MIGQQRRATLPRVTDSFLPPLRPLRRALALGLAPSALTLGALRCGGLALALLLSACVGPPGRGPGPGDPAGPGDADGLPRRDSLAEVERQGWPAGQADVVLTEQDWSLDGRPRIAATLLAPAQGERLPVVLYLPGLGQEAGAGLRWRRAWAQAGYAVVSIQALEADAQAFRSERARTLDFTRLGRERFAPAELQQRVDALAAWITEARRRGASGEAPWARLDWRHAAVAGFDVGAYTAAALGGEQIAGLRLPPGLPDWRLVIALSPHPTSPDSHQTGQWRADMPPALLVTGLQDGDPLGLMPGEPRRESVFDALPAGDKHLLLVDSLTHAALGDEPEPQRSAASRSKPGGAGGGGGGMGGPGGGGGGGGRGGGGGGGGGGSGGRPSGGPEGSESGGPGESVAQASVRIRPEDAARNRLLIGAVTHALLDAMLQDNAQARRWLNERAPAWVDRQRAELLQR